MESSFATTHWLGLVVGWNFELPQKIMLEASGVEYSMHYVELFVL
jgi:hypothetical protein